MHLPLPGGVMRPSDGDPRSEGFSIHLAKQYFRFATAHFLLFGDGRREELHGHNYRVSVRLGGDLGPGGMVVDFIALKPVIAGICDELDHRTVVPTLCPELAVEQQEGGVEVRHGDDRFVFPARDVVLLPIENTSSEHFARYLTDRLVTELTRRFPELRLRRVELEVEESDGQSAIYWRQLP